MKSEFITGYHNYTLLCFVYLSNQISLIPFCMSMTWRHPASKTETSQTVFNLFAYNYNNTPNTMEIILQNSLSKYQQKQCIQCSS